MKSADFFVSSCRTNSYNCIAFNAYESQATTVKMIGFTHFIDRITAAGIKTAVVSVLYDGSNTSLTSSTTATAPAFYAFFSPNV